MNLKTGIRLATKGFSLFSSAKLLNEARKEGDKLHIADAALTVLSVMVTLAIIIRDLREEQAEGAEANRA